MTASAYLTSADRGTRLQAAQRAAGFQLVENRVCLKKIVDPAHRHPAGGPGDQGCPFRVRLGHPRLWRTASGELFATAEPFAVQLTELDWLFTASRELGLNVMLDGRSVYHPGYTFTILITRPGSQVTLADLALPALLT